MLNYLYPIECLVWATLNSKLSIWNKWKYLLSPNVFTFFFFILSCANDGTFAHRRSGRIQAIRAQTPKKWSSEAGRSSSRPSALCPSPAKRKKERGNMVRVGLHDRHPAHVLLVESVGLCWPFIPVTCRSRCLRPSSPESTTHMDMKDEMRWVLMF